MRKVTKEEAKAWKELAREHGFVNEEGHFALGRFVVDESDENHLHMQFITPLPAGLYTENDLQLKTPPILFERTSTGEIILHP